MVLSDAGIEAAVNAGHLRLDPFDDKCLRPSSYLLRIGSTLLVSGDDIGVLDTRSEDTAARFTAVTVSEGGFDLEPGRFYLGSSLEKVSMGDGLVGWLSPLSSLARIGLSVNYSSSLVSATFSLEKPGALTFEIQNNARWPIRIYPNVKFCHLVLLRHHHPAQRSYPGIYSGALGPVASDFSRKPSR